MNAKKNAFKNDHFILIDVYRNTARQNKNKYHLIILRKQTNWVWLTEIRGLASRRRKIIANTLWATSEGVISLFRNANEIQKWTYSQSVQIAVLGLEYSQLKMTLVLLLLHSLSTVQQKQV